MNSTTVERQKLIEAVNNLPDEGLVELVSFLDYLCYKTRQQIKPDNNGTSFLLSVAGLGNSGEQDISEQDKQIFSP